jgi:hypothetical protein
MSTKPQWKPIETAPLDSLILICYDYHYSNGSSTQHIQTSYWSNSVKSWNNLALLIRKGVIATTHWMPLPKPPTYEKK